jgi:hypothetical protein
MGGLLGEIGGAPMMTLMMIIVFVGMMLASEGGGVRSGRGDVRPNLKRLDIDKNGQLYLKSEEPDEVSRIFPF